MTHPTTNESVLSTLMAVQLPTTVGLDLSDRVSHFHVQRGDRRTLDAGKVATTRADLTVPSLIAAATRRALRRR
jgi:hypothetical protein